VRIDARGRHSSTTCRVTSHRGRGGVSSERGPARKARGGEPSAPGSEAANRVVGCVIRRAHGADGDLFARDRTARPLAGRAPSPRATWQVAAVWAAGARVGRAGRRGWCVKRSLVLTSADAPGTRRLAFATSVRHGDPIAATKRAAPCGPFGGAGAEWVGPSGVLLLPYRPLIADARTQSM
jgi:hypothetical protein